MRINVHAGHAKDGNSFCGADGGNIGVKESVENRKIKDSIIKYLKADGNTVFDCTVDSGISATDILKKICAKCNSEKVDIDLSIHLNAYQKAKKDGKVKGVECWCYNSSSTAAKTIANRICKNIAGLGFTNRGVKFNSGYYVLRNTNAQAIIIECFFCDDEDDVLLYKKVGYDAIGKAIAEAVVNKKISTASAGSAAGGTFIVRIIADELNVRSGAGLDYKVNQVVKKGEAFTIVDVKGADGITWGKLKSGAGWISLNSKYVTRI